MPAVLRIVLAAAVAALALFAGMWLARERPFERLELDHATVFSTPRPLPDFKLVDQAGATFGPDRLKGQWHILFFGFTHCPDVCPTTLTTLTAARRELADLPPVQRPGVVMISLDPQRDTPDRLAGYVSFFDPEFIGLTGDPDAIRSMTQDLGVAVIVGKPDPNGQYTIDHTATLFLVDPEGRLAGVFGMPHSTEGIVHDYRVILGHAPWRRG